MARTAEIFRKIRVGDEVAPTVHGPITRTTLALFAGASYDHVSLHIDTDAAKAAGFPDVFAHGMLSMAYLAQMLTHWQPQAQLRSFRVRFAAITPVHAVVRCTGKVTEIVEINGENRARIMLQAQMEGNVVTLQGEAVIALMGTDREERV